MTYAVDDHNLLVYVPGVVLVFLPWRFVADRLDLCTSRQAWESSKQRYVVFVIQALFTLELLFPLQLLDEHPAVTPARMEGIICAWMWAILVLLGWVDFFLSRALNYQANLCSNSSSDPTRGKLTSRYAPDMSNSMACIPARVAPR